MPTGVIVSYDPDSGKGQIQPDGQDEEFAFEVDSDDVPGGRTLREGMRVSYDVEGGMAGVIATDVRPIASAR